VRVKTDKLAQQIRFAQDSLVFNLLDEEIDPIYEQAQSLLKQWAVRYRRKQIILKGAKMVKVINNIANTPPKVGVAEDALLHTSISPKSWSREWVDIFNLMVNAENPLGLIRLSDHRQCWVNQAAANLFASTGAEMTQRQVSRFWFPESLERLEKELRTGHKEFEIAYRAYKNETSPDVMEMVGRNRIVELDGEFYRLSSNLSSKIIQLDKA